MPRMRTATTLLACIILIFACKDQTTSPIADKVLTGGVIYTANSGRQMAQAVAIKNDTIVYVGDKSGAEAWIGEQTDVVDLAGRLVLPGLHDSHIHPAGILEYERCDLAGEPRTLAETSSFVKECISRLQVPEGNWLSVDLWNYSDGNEPDAQYPTVRAALDGASSKHKIHLKGDHHGAFNSLALAGAKDPNGSTIGLSASTIESHFSALRALISVDERGEPNGRLTDAGVSLVSGVHGIDQIYSPDEIVSEAHQIPKRLNRSGITSILDAATTLGMQPLYDTLIENGLLTFRVHLAQVINPVRYVDEETGKLDRAAIVEQASLTRDKYRDHPLIQADSVKLFSDGVLEANPRTDPPTLGNAAMLEPYDQPLFVDADGGLTIKGYVDTASEACVAYRTAPEKYLDAEAIATFRASEGHHPGQCVISDGLYATPESLIYEFVDAFHDNDYMIHIHAIGDRAVHASANAIAAARKNHGQKSLPHGLAHLQYVHPDDVALIGEQGLYVAFTFSWIQRLHGYDLTVLPFIDEIAGVGDMYNDDHYGYRQAYPVSDLKKAGAVIVGGSDAPVGSRDPQPFTNIEHAVSRAVDGDEALYAANAISIQDAIDSYTINGAQHLQQQTITGSIEVGKKADLIVLDRNIIELAEAGRTNEISDTIVELTYFDGKLVHKTESKQ